MSRLISQDEAILIERVLAIGANGPILPSSIASIPTLQVTDTCKCGCATVWFGPNGAATTGHNLAEVIALINNETVNVIVWSQGETIVGLEIVGYGQTGLPDFLSVKPYCDA
ncbi:hypothetical protein [Solilutibacter silvestris]|uniref:hypothetical protein n=1 Tax=Solilutibacter silvestris TaxID=1645665 RepID=UPI000CA001F1|nr:hypothetical protein [Lysobacter silvestris]